ncbi:hypothetical protein B0H17DRAFT_1212176 [Mycena rosella]|uniref:Uncharacterized protein n=1 Tax=Mycena rosella TaxID=1033263 RepID=A0AAD7CSX3_MYCRO|nr:hypothetical protein B0H17DRAFT_1212176 [Mycena rosella]
MRNLAGKPSAGKVELIDDVNVRRALGQFDFDAVARALGVFANQIRNALLSNRKIVEFTPGIIKFKRDVQKTTL